MFERIKEIFAHQLNIEEESLTRDTSFFDDLILDSLDIIELTVTIREEFNLPSIPVTDFAKLRSMGDLVDYIAAKIG